MLLKGINSPTYVGKAINKLAEYSIAWNVYFDDVHKIGEYDPNEWNKKLLRDAHIKLLDE